MESVLIRHLFAGIFSFLLTFYLLPLITRAAIHLGILDIPDGQIKCHQAPVPYLGGVAIFIAFVATLALAYPFKNEILWLVLGTTLLVFTGLIDDLHVLKPQQKLFGQIIAVLCFLKGGFSLKTTFFSSLLSFLISGFWMLSVINAFNLVDVMDGLSSLIAMIAAFGFLVIAIFFHQYEVSLLLVPFICAVFAFFLYNKPPAKIYLGDAGSMFLGGFLSAIPMLFYWSHQATDAYYTPAIILAVPLLEVFFLIIIRTYLGIPFYKGSPHHFSLYLQRKGMSKYEVLSFTACMSIAFALLGILFLINLLSLLIAFILAAVFVIVWCVCVFTQSFGVRCIKK